MTPRPTALRRHGVLARSTLVGAVATAIDLALLWLFIGALGMAPAWANVPALTVGLAVQFAGNKWFAFRDTSAHLVRQGALFTAVEIGAFALNVAAFHALAVWAGMPFVLARIASSAAVYFGFSYPLWGRIFRPAPHPSTPEAPR